MGKIPGRRRSPQEVAAADRINTEEIMSIPVLYTQGLQLMLMGMGFVFVFLGLLVAMVSLMSRVFKPLHDTAPSESIATETEPGSEGDLMADPELISVITSAIQNYRTQKQKPDRG